MTDASPSSANQSSHFGRPRAFDTILYGGLVVGVLDALDATIFFGLRGSSAQVSFNL